MKLSNWKQTITGAVLCAAIVMCGAARGIAATTVQDEPGSTCMICHGKLAKVYKKSVHEEFEVTCTDCHGGDPTKTEWKQAMSPDAGFVGSFEPKEVLNLCANCHGDYDKMRQFGLPVDQLQQYRTSKHGKALLKNGNKKVAVCTSCHGVHDILAVKNPKAHVYPTNVPGTCGKCHSDKKYMAPFKVPVSVVADYKKGVHGKRLLEMDLAAPTCATCHGNHGAAPPGVVEVVNICGTCHSNIRDEFKKSVHYKKKLECINCHNNHNNVLPTTAIFRSKKKGGCLHCHNKPGDKAVAFIENNLKLLDQAQHALKHAEKSIKKAEFNGFYTENEQVMLKEGDTALIGFRNIQHTLSKTQIEKQLKTVTSKAEHIDENITVMSESIIDRRIIMSGVGAYLLLLLILLIIKFRRLKKAYMKDRAQEYV